MEPPFTLVGWEEWQTYRKDRGQPPWIKVHRRLMRNEKWISLSDAERGQLVAMWLLAADHDGVIVASIPMIQKICFMSTPLKMNKFIELGFVRHDGVKATPSRQPSDAPVQSSSGQSRAEEAPTPNGRQAPTSPKRKSGWPKDFTLTPHRRALAETYWKDRGVTFDAVGVWERFEAVSKAAGKVWVDWDQAWVTWYAKQVDFAKNGNGRASTSSTCLNRLPRDGRLRDCGKPSTTTVGSRPLCAECYADYQARQKQKVGA